MSGKVCDARVHGQPNYVRKAPSHDTNSEVRMLIVALDYKETQEPLTCSMDGKNMEAFAKSCQVQDVTTLYDRQCTKERVLAALKATCARCQHDDYFVFYFAGHGVNIKDVSGDEADGQDEAFVLVNDSGAVDRDTCLIDDEFSQTLLTDCHPATRIMVIADCCHSGSIADLERSAWRGREAISLAGCRDGQTSGDTGKGGIFTHSLLLAVSKMCRVAHSEYSAGALYNAALEEADAVFHAVQHIEVHTSPGLSPDKFAWPLLPAHGYEAPLQSAVDGSAGTVHPATLQYVKQEAIAVPVAIEEYLLKVTGSDVAVNGGQRDCSSRACTGCPLQ